MDIIINTDNLNFCQKHNNKKILFGQCIKEREDIIFLCESCLIDNNIDIQQCFKISDAIQCYNKQTLNSQLMIKKLFGSKANDQLKEDIALIRKKLDQLEIQIEEQEKRNKQFFEKQDAQKITQQFIQNTDFMMKLGKKKGQGLQYKDCEFEQQLQSILSQLDFSQLQDQIFQVKKENQQMEEVFKKQVLLQQQIESLKNTLQYDIYNIIDAEIDSQNSNETVNNCKVYNDYKSYIYSPFRSLESIRKMQQQFATDRDWDQYHSPRNLLLALAGEIGELCEIFQWKGEVEIGLKGFTEDEKIRVGEEVSDCFLYLIRFADRCRINLVKAIERKIIYNGMKYKPDFCKGQSDKYTAYTHLID